MQGKKWRGGVIWSPEERCRCRTHLACVVVVTELGQSSGPGLAGRMWWLGKPDVCLASWWKGRAVPSRILLFSITVIVILVQLQYFCSLHAGATHCESWCGLCDEAYLVRFYWFCCLTFLRIYYLYDYGVWGQLETTLRSNSSKLLKWDSLAHPVIHPCLCSVLLLLISCELVGPLCKLTLPVNWQGVSSFLSFCCFESAQGRGWQVSDSAKGLEQIVQELQLVQEHFRHGMLVTGSHKLGLERLPVVLQPAMEAFSQSSV